jgi:hypothetical protein
MFLLAHAKEMLSDQDTLQRVEKPEPSGPAAPKAQPPPRETSP